MKKIAIFPGSFDPIHPGHLNIIEKASKLFDYLYVVITFNEEKKSSYYLSFLERKELMDQQIKNYKNVEVMINESEMTADFAKKLNIKYLIRSARNNTDFKYELELAAGSNSLNQDLETLLIIPSYKNIHFESRLLKQRKKNYKC